VWADARAKALTPAQHRSPLGRRPYDAPRRRIPADQLRRPGNRGRRAGHGVAVLLKIYAHCIDGQADAANHRITDAFSAGDALISNITDVVADEIVAWQTRPLDAFYAIIYIDALVVKVRDGGMVQNKAAYLAVGADADGFKHVLGIRLGGDEGASFWAGVLAELRNRGVKDVLFVCCDGLEGLCCAKTQHMV
jgi:putative transposase